MRAATVALAVGALAATATRAAGKAGASLNITDPSIADAITGNAAFDAVPVRVEAA